MTLVSMDQPKDLGDPDGITALSRPRKHIPQLRLRTVV